MWKESYRIGVITIDEQHKGLFAKTEELLNEVKDGVAGCAAHKQKCISTILFLKDYAVKHFDDEEAYQKLVGCAGFEAHKKMHEKFVTAVLDHEKRMVESDFSEKEIRAFTGMLVAWLLYHVADTDQKIGKEVKKPETLHGNADIVFSSVCNVLSKLTGIDSGDIKKAEAQEQDDDSITVEIGLEGDVSGYITFVYPPNFVKNLMYSMMDFMPESIGDLEISALFEASNIMGGAICSGIARSKGIVCDITPPMMGARMAGINPDETVVIDTTMGIIETDIVIDY
jgi:hemerythrin-like metal-binding protein